MEKRKFDLVSEFKPAGDQPKAIKDILSKFKNNQKEVTLLGATGTGKTFTMSNTIKELNKPTLILAHNKTLAGQLYMEMKQLFPNNRVEYFISNFDFYQPEAYKPNTDTFIEKTSKQNWEIEIMRLSAMNSLLTRTDTIVVASVACIFSLSNPEKYKSFFAMLTVGQEYNRKEFIRFLIHKGYKRVVGGTLRPGEISIKGDVIEILPLWKDQNSLIRVDLYDNIVNSIHLVDVMNKNVIKKFKQQPIFPAYETIVDRDDVERTVKSIEDELTIRLDEFEKEDKLLERQRLEQRVNFDLEQLREYGTCSGIENYTMYLDGRKVGQEPYTIIDYFPKDFLMIIDESHMSLPQIKGMYNGDQARKKTLVDYGFRLPSALNNRPLMFEEFYGKTDKLLFVSATPSEFELEKDNKPAEQIVRPTGLLDPQIEIRKTEGQMDDIIKEIEMNVKNEQRTFITTTTIKMSEDLTEYLKERDIKCAYVHSELKTFQRADVLRKLRLGVFDVVIGINLLREGLDIPEASLMIILEADKDGLFRNKTALIQNIGRVSRNVDGRVIMYADSMTVSMQGAIDETDRRRSIQEEYNKKNKITPKTIIKPLEQNLNSKLFEKYDNVISKKANKKEYEKLIKELEVDMKLAAKAQEFETAAEIRDLILELKNKMIQ